MFILGWKAGLVVITLIEGLGSVPSTHVAAHNHL